MTYAGFEVRVRLRRAIIPGFLHTYGYQIYRHWDDVVAVAGLLVGERVVLTKTGENRLSLMRFGHNGFQMNHENHFPTRLRILQGHAEGETGEYFVLILLFFLKD